jgi:hypothetical protein
MTPDSLQRCARACRLAPHPSPPLPSPPLPSPPLALAREHVQKRVPVQDSAGRCRWRERTENDATKHRQAGKSSVASCPISAALMHAARRRLDSFNDVPLNSSVRSVGWATGPEAAGLPSSPSLPASVRSLREAVHSPFEWLLGVFPTGLSIYPSTGRGVSWSVGHPGIRDGAGIRGRHGHRIAPSSRAPAGMHARCNCHR